MDWIEKRPFYHWVLLIIAFALLLRLPNLGRDSLWIDEAISYLTIHFSVPDLLKNTLEDPHPPLYYILLKGWQSLVPNSDTAIRWLSVLWNLFLIPLIGRLTIALFAEKKLALLTMLMVALSPFHILYSHELRMYTQLMFLVTLGTWAYWQARQNNSWRWWLLFGVVFATAVYTHLFAILALGAINLHALTETDRRTVFPRVFLISLGLGLLFLPWGLTIFAESQKELGSLRPLAQDNIFNPIKPLTSLAFLLFGISSNLIYSGIAFFICLALIIVLLIDSRRLRQDGVSPAWRLIMWEIGLVLGIPLLVYMIRPFFLPERTMAAASPFLIIFLAWSMTRKQSPLPYLATLSIGLMVVGSLMYHFGEPLKPPYGPAMAYISENIESGDAILHTSDGSYLPALRYIDFDTHTLLAGDPDPRKSVVVYHALGGELWTVDEALGHNGRIWLVVALEHSLEWQQEQAQLFTNNLELIEKNDIGGIQIYLYTK